MIFVDPLVDGQVSEQDPGMVGVIAAGLAAVAIQTEALGGKLKLLLRLRCRFLCSRRWTRCDPG